MRTLELEAVKYVARHCREDSEVKCSVRTMAFVEVVLEREGISDVDLPLVCEGMNPSDVNKLGGVARDWLNKKYGKG